jgi:hypothetical protein
MSGAATWRSRFIAVAIALTVNLIILLPMLTTQGRTLWTREVNPPRDAIITFTPQQDIDRAPAPTNTSPSNGPRARSSTTAINRAPASAYLPSASEPLPKALSTPALTSEPSTASSATSDVSAAVRKALQGLAACSASRSRLGPSEQPDTCRREYAKGPEGLSSASFIDPVKRAQFDAVAKAQEAKRATLQGPIPDGYVACTGYRSNAMFGCPPPPPTKMPAANLWEASAPSTNARGDP